MTDLEAILLLDQLAETYTAIITDCARQRSEVRRQRAIINSRAGEPPRYPEVAERIPLDAVMRETQETARA